MVHAAPKKRIGHFPHFCLAGRKISLSFNTKKEEGTMLSKQQWVFTGPGGPVK